jgi:hypothetical protein
VKSPVRFTILLIISVLAGFLAYRFVPVPLPEISRGEFLDEVRAGHVRKIEIEDQKVILSESTTRGPFRTKFDKIGDARLADELRGLGVEVWYSRSAMGI